MLQINTPLPTPPPPPVSSTSIEKSNRPIHKSREGGNLKGKIMLREVKNNTPKSKPNNLSSSDSDSSSDSSSNSSSSNSSTAIATKVKLRKNKNSHLSSSSKDRSYTSSSSDSKSTSSSSTSSSSSSSSSTTEINLAKKQNISSKKPHHQNTKTRPPTLTTVSPQSKNNLSTSYSLFIFYFF